MSEETDAKMKVMRERFERDLPGEIERMNKAEAEYHTALGKFIETFATVESGLFAYLQRAAHMSDTTARIVASGWRTGNMITFVQSVWKAEPPPPEDAFLQDAVGQLTHINNLRNSLIHYASAFEFADPDEPRLSSNAGRHVPSKPATEFRVSATMLTDCTSDLQVIYIRFLNYQTRESLSLEDRAGYSIMNPDYAWLCKPNASPPAKSPKPKSRHRKK
ncbi:MAG TPA: hypothetical protein VGQ98_00105 [Gemmatimonadaceae bacterium]|nr:hypothetical protein [Gemmatimonadaceae bacterium]